MPRISKGYESLILKYERSRLLSGAVAPALSEKDVRMVRPKPNGSDVMDDSRSLEVRRMSKQRIRGFHGDERSS